MRYLLLRGGCVVGALLLVSACSASEEAAAPPFTTADVTALLQEALDAGPGFAYADLVARLGPPIRLKAEPMAGRAGQQDTLRTLIYYGLEVALQEGAAPSRLAHVAFTDARYTSPEGLRLGYAESQVLTTLGVPTRREPAQLVYEKESPQPCTLVLLMEHQKVSRMEWHFTNE